MTKKRKKIKNTRNTGYVLVLMLVVMTIAFIIGSNMMVLGEQNHAVATREVEFMQARMAADSGLQNALQDINNAVEAGSFSAASLPSAENVSLPYLDSTYSYTTTYSAINGYGIECTGMYNGQIHTVRVKLKQNSLLDYGISCSSFLSVNQGALLDAYDSRISDNPADCSEKIVIGSQNEGGSFISLDNGVVVDGDVFCGPGKDPEAVIGDTGATITGQEYALSSSLVYPILSAPTMYGPDTSITFSRTEKTMGSGGDYPATGRFTEINLGTASTLRVTDDCTIHVTGLVSLGPRSKIIVEDGASLKVYVDNGWTSGVDCSLDNVGGNPADMCIIQSKDVENWMIIRAQNDFCGVIYAPGCGVDISTGNDFRGAVVSWWLKLHTGSRFLYDVALRGLGLGGGAFEIDRWQED